MPRDETSLSSQDTGKLMGRDTEVTKLSVLEDDQGTLPRESSSEVVSTETTERSISNMLNATDKGKAVENKPSGELKNIKSKFQDGYRKHVITAGVVIVIVFCLRLIL